MATEHDRLQKLHEKLSEIAASDISYHESQRHYKEWATQEESYDKLHDHTTYSSPWRMAREAAKLFLRPELKLVLDLGAGTGMSGETLKKSGFKKIHALEPCTEFVPNMESKRVYEKILNERIGGGSIVSAPDRSYDVIVASGSFGPGCITCDALYEVVRLLKPGGYFVNSMRKEFMWTVPEYKDRLKPLLQLLTREGRWREVKWETYPGHFFEKDGVMMIFQRI